MLTPAPYRFGARPRLSEREPASAERNCRRLVQDYVLEHHGRFLSRDAVEQPGLWHKTGRFIDLPTATSLRAQLSRISDGAVLLAERVRDASGNLIDRSVATFDTIEDYRLHLHTAIYLARFDAGLFSAEIPRTEVENGTPAILHSTAIAGCTCVWSPEFFEQYYRLVAAKDVSCGDADCLERRQSGDSLT